VVQDFFHQLYLGFLQGTMGSLLLAAFSTTRLGAKILGIPAHMFGATTTIDSKGSKE